MNDEKRAAGETVCPQCSLGRHDGCDMTVLVDQDEHGENIWEECACHRRGHYA